MGQYRGGPGGQDPDPGSQLSDLDSLASTVQVSTLLCDLEQVALTLWASNSSFKPYTVIPKDSGVGSNHNFKKSASSVKRDGKGTAALYSSWDRRG